jgi:hypothetical protein
LDSLPPFTPTPRFTVNVVEWGHPGLNPDDTPIINDEELVDRYEW